MKSAAIVFLLAGALCGCSKGSNSSSGASMYIANCASCHQPNGQGLAGSFPPLAGSQIVNGDPVKLVHIVKYGITGPLAVAGKPYDGMMPAWSPTLSDDAIASLLTYLRSSWGNHAGAVTAAQVNAVSK